MPGGGQQKRRSAPNREPEEKRMPLRRIGLVEAACLSSLLGWASIVSAQVFATVHVNAGAILNPVSDIGIGLHTSVYANQFTNPLLPTRIAESGVQMLRYPGGSYSDLYQWSTHSSNLPGAYIASGSNFANFVRVMEGAKDKGMVTVDYGDSFQGTMGGQPKEAGAWVAYANSNSSIYGTPNDISIGLDAEGNNWYTAGYWAKLRSSTVAQYRQWSQAAGTYNSRYEFLAMNHPTPVGIKYWEIGNEIGGNGYTGVQWEYDRHAPYNNGDTSDNAGRKNNPLLSPSAYATNYNQFATVMKAIDPTIKIGAGLDDHSTQANHDILSIAGAKIDFGIVHWYPSGSASQILAAPQGKLPGIVQAIKSDMATYAGKSQSQYELHITEFGYGATPPQGSYNSFFVADSYLTGMEQGIKSMEQLEMSKAPYLGDSSSLNRGEVYYAMQMTSRLTGHGGDLIPITSNLSTLRTHATRLPDGGLAIMLINEASGGSSADVMASVDVSGLGVASAAQYYEYGWNNVAASAAPYTQTLSGLGNTFTLRVPNLSMVSLVFAPVPEPSMLILAGAAGLLTLTRRPRRHNAAAAPANKA
jgi:hypothetical protein